MNEVALKFISQHYIDEAVKYLVSADGGHLPVSDASGKPNHRLMGAAWAALHGGYRGNKYAGPNKSAAISKLKAMYKSEGMETPEESFSITGGEFFDEALRDSDSHSGARSRVHRAINQKVEAGCDMDCDGDDDSGAGYDQAHVMGMYGSPEKGKAVYSMSGKMFQVNHSQDEDGDMHVGKPSEVETSYVPVANGRNTDESFSESYASFDVANESAYNASKGELTVTVIRPGTSKNNRHYSPALLKKSAGIFEGAKMFADHQSDREMKERPEGSVNNWVATLKNVKAESDGTVKGTAVLIDPAFKAKVETLNEHKLLPQLGVSIRAAGKYSDTPHTDGSKAVESLDFARSVDFVTFAGAGGQAENLV